MKTTISKSQAGALALHSNHWSVVFWPLHLRMMWQFGIYPNLNDTINGGKGKVLALGPLEIRYYTLGWDEVEKKFQEEDDAIQEF